MNNNKYNFPDEYIKTLIEFHKIDTDLYWKRATYFWTFIGAIFASYFLVINKNEYTFNIKLLIESFGVVFSLGWYLVNRGSYFWFENWKNKLKSCNKEWLSNIFNDISFKYKSYKLFGPYHFDVIKINNILSLFVFIIWLILFIINDCNNYFISLNLKKIDILATLFNVLTILFIIILLIFGKIKNN